jgi:glycosyltransferase involved in cell wall biosynthesis
VKIAFYCPMKPVSHPRPSGDREIARSLFQELAEEHEVFVLSDFHRRGQSRSYPLALMRAYAKARAEKPDLFFTYHLYYKSPDLIGLLLSCWFRRPYVVCEGSWNERAPWGIGRILSAWGFRRARVVFSIKRKDHESLEKRFPGKSVLFRPNLTFPPGVCQRDEARKRLGVEANEALIVTVAMLRAGRKAEGVRLLLRSLGSLAREGLPLRWVHAGGGVEEGALQALCRAELGSKGLMLGTLDATGVSELLTAGDLFAFPGIDEAFGLAYLEAQEAGLPVVAFSGLVDAVIPGQTALLAENEDEFRDAIRELVLDPRLREKMGEQGRSFARGFAEKRLNSLLQAKLDKKEAPGS